MMGKLVLLRHGESEWNKDNLFCGWCDIKLTDKGKSQAKSCADLLIENDLKPDIVFTSKLTRSIQTANIILDNLDSLWVDLYKNWRLNERHYGKLQGLSKSTTLQAFGEEKYMYWRRDYHGCPPLVEDIHSKNAGINDRRYLIDNSIDDLPRGESLEMVVDRLIPFFKSDILPHVIEGETVFIVTHGSVVRALTKYLYDIDDKSIAEINIPNGIPMLIRLNEDLKPISSEFEYLDPHTAKIEAEKVKMQGFENHTK